MFFSNGNPRFDRASMNTFVSGGVKQASIALIGENGSAGRLFLENIPVAQTIEDAINGNVEGLAERIADVISDTHDLDVTDDNYGVAVACELLGVDPDTVYAARRAKKEAAA